MDIAHMYYLFAVDIFFIPVSIVEYFKVLWNLT